MSWIFVAALAVGLAIGGTVAAQTSGSTELAPGVTATVTSLKRLPTNGLVQLDFRVENSSTSPVTLGGLGLRGGNCVGNIGLIDFVNGDNHQIGSTTGGCLSSPLAQTGDNIGPGQSFEGWAWFRPSASASGPFAVSFGDAMPILDVPLQ